MPREPAPQREPMGLCLPVFNTLTQPSLFMRTFRIECLPFSEQFPSAPDIECELTRGRKRGGLRNRDEVGHFPLDKAVELC